MTRSTASIAAAGAEYEAERAARIAENRQRLKVRHCLFPGIISLFYPTSKNPSSIYLKSFL